MAAWLAAGAAETERIRANTTYGSSSDLPPTADDARHGDEIKTKIHQEPPAAKPTMGGAIRQTRKQRDARRTKVRFATSGCEENG